MFERLMYSYKSKVVIRNQKRNWEKRNRQNWKKKLKKTKCKNHKRLMQILVSFQKVLWSNLLGTERTRLGHIICTFSTKYFGFIRTSFSWFRTLLMSLNKYGRPSYSQIPLITDLQSRQWSAGYEKFICLCPPLTWWPMKIML